ncbi:MAG: nucleoside phosphorylase [Mucilaginibacter polytrichastri]|nr:nucleoside phosphorylase [Mucilaginibacter polytrichastri]
MRTIAESEMVLNADGSVYHLNLLPDDLAETVITVGDPDRVAEVSKCFDRIELRKGKREFLTHTGYIGNTRVSVVSTGIGTDNIDIVLNELDALVNLDLEKRQVKKALKPLSIIRIGTSGSIRPDIGCDDILVSSHALGLDTLMQYYQWDRSREGFPEGLHEILGTLPSYFAPASEDLLAKFSDQQQGITVTAPGFYAPQGRYVRAEPAFPDLFRKLAFFTWKNRTFTNLEMETAGIYALSALLGHKALSVNAILGNRTAGTFSKNPEKTISAAIDLVLERL